MIRYATASDIHGIVKCIKKFTERPPYNARHFSVVYIADRLEDVLQDYSYDLVVDEINDEIQGCACACLTDTLLCPEPEYHELFLVTLNPALVRGLVRWMVKRAEERACKRVVIGSTTQNERYEKLLQVAGGMQSYGKTFVKEL